MRLTIERLRTLVLVVGILIIAAIFITLGVGKWKNRFIKRDIPQRLGADIQQEGKGWTYTQSRGGRTLFRIHAGNVVQLKKGSALLRQVEIELFGQDGSSVDRIEGNEFEYDQQSGVARAAGPVAITLVHPGQSLAISPQSNPQQTITHDTKDPKLAAAMRSASSGAIHVRTSGLSFNQKDGIATTANRVEFDLRGGSGSAQVATFDSGASSLVLNSAVDIRFERAGQPIQLLARHAEFNRTDQQCDLLGAQANYRGSTAKAEHARLLFRNDGSAQQLDAQGGFELVTAAGGHLAAPNGTLTFDARNQPQKGSLTGGVVLNEAHEGRTVQGGAPAMNIDFSGKGELRHARMTGGVQIVSDEQSLSASQPVRTHRTWRSPVVDLDFRDATAGGVELASIHGTGGVTVGGETRRGNEPPQPSRFAADEVTGLFGAQSSLSALVGTGHALMEQTTAAGAMQTTSGDRIEAHLSGAHAAQPKTTGKTKSANSANGQIESASVEGHVVVVQQASAKSPDASLRATADRAAYDAAADRLHLAGSPRVENAGLQLAADSIDVTRSTGDAIAHGNVKATWFGNAGKAQGGAYASFGATGPAHAVANDATLSQSTGEATLRGKARMWQQANSISAPVLVLNRRLQTLDAHATQTQPVEVVLLSAASASPMKATARKQNQPSVIRVTGGELKYSAAERKAWMQSGITGRVRAEADGAVTSSNATELVLLPSGNHAGKDGAEAQVDTLTATGNVVVSSGARKGTGEKLVYTGDDGKFVLTGTASVPPRLTDPARGTVTGAALIFNSSDDSVSIEGGGRRTTAETLAPR